MNGVLILSLAIICALSLVSGQFSTSLSSSSSNIFRTSPFGRCGSQTVDLRENSYPCLSPRQYAFAQLASTNVTIPSIASLLGNDLNGIRTVYIGNAIGGIQVVHPNQAGFNGSFGTSVQNIPGPGGANPAGLIASFTDKTSFVAFVDSTGVVSKYSLLPDGTFNTNLTTTVNTGVQGTISVIVKLPNVYIAGGTRIATLDTTTMVASNINAPATIACGVAADANTNFIYYSTTSGTIFAYDTAGKSIAGTVTVAGVTSFSPACGARPGTYGLFVSKPTAGTTASIYQYGYSQAQGIGTLEYVVDGIGNLGQTPGPSAMNADSSALYFVTYTPDGTITYLANIYEFRLYDESFDFMSVTQEEQVPNTVFINPTIITPLVGNSIYIGANTPQIPRVYEFFVPSAYGGPSNNTNITTTINLVPDPLPAKNPDGAPGKVNSIGDVGQVYGNGDIIFGNGIGYYPTAPANTSTILNSRGAQITYIRGTTTEAPAHAGPSNNNGISLKLVSLDEVSSSGFNSSVRLIKSIPVYDSNDAPWYSPRTSNQFANGGGAVTGVTWNFGQTETTDNAAVMYSYLVPPYARVSSNGTIPQPATPSKKRSPAPGPNQYTPGYMSMSVTISTFATNTSTGFIVGTPYNITSRYVQYDFSITNFPFTSNANILRLTMALGLGLDGNNSLGAFPLGANSTTPPLVPGYMFLTPTADWTVLLPQKATLNNIISAAPHACTYDVDSHLLSLYMPSGTNVTTGYTLFVEYSYVPPPPIPANNEDGGGPKLLPLWIVIGVVGGIVIIAIIVAIIVVVVVYKVAGDKIKAWILDQQMDMTEGALREDRGAFPS